MKTAREKSKGHYLKDTTNPDLLTEALNHTVNGDITMCHAVNFAERDNEMKIISKVKDYNIYLKRTKYTLVKEQVPLKNMHAMLHAMLNVAGIKYQILLDITFVNEIQNSTADMLKQEVINEIKDFFSVVLEEGTVVSVSKYLSICVHHSKENNPSFLGDITLADSTVHSIKETVIKCFQDNGIVLQK